MSGRKQFHEDDGGTFVIVTGILVALAVLGASLLASPGVTQAGPDASPEERVSSLAVKWEKIRGLLDSEVARRGTATMTAADAIDAFNDAATSTKDPKEAFNLETFIIARHSELAYVNGANAYDVWTVTGTHITGAYDGVDDGIIFADGGTGTWLAVVADVNIGDGFREIAEIVVFAIPPPPS